MKLLVFTEEMLQVVYIVRLLPTDVLIIATDLTNHTNSKYLSITVVYITPSKHKTSTITNAFT